MIETLVVLVIISVVLGVVRLNITTLDSREKSRTLEQLTRQLNHVIMLSSLRGTSYGLGFSHSEYQFYQAVLTDDDLQWRPAPARQLSGHRLSSGRWSVTIDNSLLELTDRLPASPQLTFAYHKVPADYRIWLIDRDYQSSAIEPGKRHAALFVQPGT